MPSSDSPPPPWLHRFASFTAGATLFLICIGGMVTSKGAGMSVPDWPNSYGYNMFLFPWHRMVGGIFWEHGHRLVASGVGLLTVILAVALWRLDKRPWIRWLGLIAVLMVILQGVLGGLRVTLYKDQLGIFHACIAQAFLILTGAIALFTSRWWSRYTVESQILPIQPADVARFLRWTLVATLLVYVQLILGATMRHEHAGLAIHDFPTAYGQWWPRTDSPTVDMINVTRAAHFETPTTATQILLQMSHRLGAVAVFAAIASCAWLAWTSPRLPSFLRKTAYAWLGLVVLQIALGAWTIWSNKAADVATTHVTIGAITLLTGGLQVVLSARVLYLTGALKLPFNQVSPDFVLQA